MVALLFHIRKTEKKRFVLSDNLVPYPIKHYISPVILAVCSNVPSSTTALSPFTMARLLDSTSVLDISRPKVNEEVFHLNYTRTPGNPVKDEKADFINNLRTINTPASAIARIKEQTLRGSGTEVDGEGSNMRIVDPTLTPPPIYKSFLA